MKEAIPVLSGFHSVAGEYVTLNAALCLCSQHDTHFVSVLKVALLCSSQAARPSRGSSGSRYLKTARWRSPFCPDWPRPVHQRGAIV